MLQDRAGNVAHIFPRRKLLKNALEVTGEYVKSTKFFHRFFLQYLAMEPARYDLSSREQELIAILQGFVLSAVEYYEDFQRSLTINKTDSKLEQLLILEEDQNCINRLCAFYGNQINGILKYAAKIEPICRMLSKRLGNMAFCRLMESCKEMQHFQEVPLLVHLVLPLKYFLKLSDILSSLMELTTEEHSAYNELRSCLDLSCKYQELLHDPKSTVRARLRSLEIFDRIETSDFVTSQLISSDRVLNSEGELYRLNKDGSTTFSKALLFNDVLFLLEHPGTSHDVNVKTKNRPFDEKSQGESNWKVSHIIDLTRTWLITDLEARLHSSAFQLVTFTVVYSQHAVNNEKHHAPGYKLDWTKETLICLEEEDKQQWLTSIVNTIESLATSVPIFDCRAEIASYVKSKQDADLRKSCTQCFCLFPKKLKKFHQWRLTPEEAQVCCLNREASLEESFPSTTTTHKKSQ